MFVILAWWDIYSPCGIIYSLSRNSANKEIMHQIHHYIFREIHSSKCKRQFLKYHA